MDIRAILIPEYPIMTNFLDKPRIPKRGSCPKIRIGDKFENPAISPWGIYERKPFRKFYLDRSTLKYSKIWETKGSSRIRGYRFSRKKKQPILDSMNSKLVRRLQ